MSEIKIHIFHIGKVCVAPELPFGGEHYSALKASGVLDRKSKRLWLPVSAYLIECAHGNVLFDCGWYRDMSPYGVFSAGRRSARSARCRCILRIRLLSKAVRPSTSSSRRGASRLSIGTRCCSSASPTTARRRKSRSRGSGHRVGSGTALRASPTTISMSNRARLHYKRVNRQRQRRCLLLISGLNNFYRGCSEFVKNFHSGITRFA